MVHHRHVESKQCMHVTLPFEIKSILCEVDSTPKKSYLSCFALIKLVKLFMDHGNKKKVKGAHFAVIR